MPAYWTRWRRALRTRRSRSRTARVSSPMSGASRVSSFCNRLEIFHGAETATGPFQPGRSISGFRTGPLGLGHVVLTADKPDTIDRLMTFYCDLLGFRLTDYYSEPFVARFLHINP